MHCLNKNKWAELVTQLQGPFLQHLQQVVLPCGTVFQKARKGKSKINVAQIPDGFWVFNLPQEFPAFKETTAEGD